MAVVKADAYGHRMDRVVPVLVREGVQHFCVASLEEGMQLRSLAPKADILVLGGNSTWTRGTLDVIKKYRFEIGVNDLASLKILAREKDLKLQIKIDSGMNRLGLKSSEWSAALEMIRCARASIVGLYSHYASFSGFRFMNQVRVFDEVARWWWNEGVRPEWIHSENSAALFSKEKLPKNTFLSEVANMARPGIAMYGYMTQGFPWKLPLHPVLELSSEISWVKSVERGEGVSYDFLYKAKSSHQIGVVPLGYADGIAKSYALKLHPVLVDSKGRLKARLQICGAVCMDMLMVRSNKARLERGDRVIFWGYKKQEVVSKGFADPYELNLRIANRIPRFWVS